LELYAYKFEPIFKDYIWGGRRLGEIFNKPIPQDTITAESWELADQAEGRSVIANGPLAGKTLNEVIKAYPKTVTGTDSPLESFPLLIKLLDAQSVLSVQVHPDAETCRRMKTGSPKTECWYIIDAPADGYIYKGLKPGTTREQFKDAINNGTCEDWLVKVPVKIGECHFLPSGTVHAIGPNLVIAEIQQSSNTTYRVFDWNRVDKRTGEPRRLHVDEAIESTKFDLDESVLTVRSEGRLVDADEFKVDKIDLETCDDQYTMAGELEIYVIISGKGKAVSYGDDAPETEFSAGDTLFIPSEMIGALTADEETQMLRVTLPDIIK
jgi:mannose-6-phosphate isomerase